MAMPGNVLASEPTAGEILPPDDRFRYRCPWIDYERGGVAVGDPTQGYNVQTWRLRGISAGQPSCLYSERGTRLPGGGLMLDAPENPSIKPRQLWPATNPQEVALAFDQNMNPAAAFVDGGIGKLYWFDAARGKSVVDTIHGMRSPRLCLDDKRVTQTSSSDILLFYLSGGHLCMRQQRDRFRDEYQLKLTRARKLGRVGMGSDWRVHIELVYDDTDPGRPWYPEEPCAPSP